ncbi:uncharacterized protein LACBIDRAFT_328766 [Laccaria bicolor S238N-H82]|uniref:Predicted protein n=1 Tax=Laccaria bicolor (strain S238N-H82 / ATCC MYA-4686) TaxID=486041 RepID=B0DFX4_LACBS|nr:uncharacterized protein LACBIDRAFT_328766 [Laccaria bicolor S238N-H82]EDR06417.1 predicted protein [Laccaria bicolor S238N-H82]|eukprot:XP_001882789.1 predicted protein [Laccaria bicolor S238N-H82]
MAANQDSGAHATLPFREAWTSVDTEIGSCKTREPGRNVTGFDSDKSLWAYLDGNAVQSTQTQKARLLATQWNRLDQNMVPVAIGKALKRNISAKAKHLEAEGGRRTYFLGQDDLHLSCYFYGFNVVVTKSSVPFNCGPPASNPHLQASASIKR